MMYPSLLGGQQSKRLCGYLGGPCKHWVLEVDMDHERSSGPSLNNGGPLEEGDTIGEGRPSANNEGWHC